MESAVSVVVPARNEETFLPETLASLERIETDREYEVIVVDGLSHDRTAEQAASVGATVVDGTGTGIGIDRNIGGSIASGKWVAFLDADTVVRPTWLDTMIEFLEAGNYIAGSSRCRMPGWRASLMAGSINWVFPRMRKPILPGFNFWVRKDVFDDTGGFSCVPNEDTEYSRRLARHGKTGYCPRRLVTHSSRRITETGLTGTLYHYVRLDVGRMRST